MLLPFGTHGLPFADCSGKFILSQVILRFISSDTAVSFKTYTEMNSDQPLSRLASLPGDASASVSGRASVPATHSYTLRSRDRPPSDRENVPLTPSRLILEVAQTLVNLSSDRQFQSRTEGESLPSPLVKCTGSAPPDDQTSIWQTNATHPETVPSSNFTHQLANHNVRLYLSDLKC